METPLLAAALIVKNEEENLPGCLASLEALGPLMSEVCVYDTGSSDRTIEIAEAAGARVERGFWDADFARARNSAISMANAKWVLIIDADERVEADVPTLKRALREALKSGGLGYDTMDVPVVDVRHGRELQTLISVRLLRPGRAHYSGAIHEQVVARCEGMTLNSYDVGRSTIAVHHHGYSDEELYAEKLRRNAAIAEEVVAEAESGSDTDTLIRGLVDRARSVRPVDPDRALLDLRRVRGMKSGMRYRWWGLENLADCLIDVGEFSEAAQVTAQLRGEGGPTSYCDYLDARRLAAVGDVEAALALLRNIDSLETSMRVVQSPMVLIKARMDACLHVGVYDEAAACLIRLMASYGQIKRKHGDLLLKMWGGLPLEALVEVLVEADRGYLPAIIEEFQASEGVGPAVAESLRQKRIASLPEPVTT
ncbi:glycosyltransferase family 2 protein [Mobilicoccus caccae]|uniref:Glycosyltransferase 2-like domain-containing protein n=1 Tax=Mobilicoccus caccae TaxID=1859295 RepID=A0ABQ6IT51_9MICO|nr:glycosyltransferase family 2 protein [Mobilicoccus caccae]GMA41067.1 hypothetical protein GCM10025883_31120 [Mobilicoccus caccae]